MHNKDGRVCLFSRDDGWRGERVSTSQDDGVVCTWIGEEDIFCFSKKCCSSLEMVGGARLAMALLRSQYGAHRSSIILSSGTVVSRRNKFSSFLSRFCCVGCDDARGIDRREAIKYVGQKSRVMRKTSKNLGGFVSFSSSFLSFPFPPHNSFVSSSKKNEMVDQSVRLFLSSTSSMISLYVLLKREKK